MSLTKEMLDHATTFQYQGQRVRLLSVEDVLLIKALLQRGPEIGKHDREDILRFLKIQPEIDRVYLESRIRILEAEGRIGDIFSS